MRRFILCSYYEQKRTEMPASDGLLLGYFFSKRIPDTSQMALVGESRKAEDYPTEILTKALNITLTVLCMI